MSLYNLPDEILLVIFNYLDIYSLTQLVCVCRRFNLIVSELLVKKSNHLLVTNQMSEKFRERCKPLLSSYSSKFITHYNWINGIYKKNEIYEAPWRNVIIDGVEMTENRLWFFHNKDLYAYDRAEDGTVKKNEEDVAIQSCDSTIYAIVCCNDVIISAHQDGSIRHWRIKSIHNKNYFQLLKVHSNAHNTEIYAIDATSQYIASSSISGSIEIQKNIHEDVSAEGNKIFLNDCNYNGLVSSIAFDPTGTKLAAGANVVFFRDSPYIIIYDINKSYLNKIQDFSCPKYYICQLLWEDPHTILMCYDKHIKKMDIRTSKFVRTWYADYDLSCFSSDNLYTIVTGTFCNEALLWDQRKSAPIKVYNMPYHDKCSDKYSGFYRVRSVPFDSRHLYIASHSHFYEFDFRRDNFDRVSCLLNKF